MSHPHTTHPVNEYHSFLPNRWYAILESHRVKRRPVGIQRMGEPLVLYRRTDGNLVCMLDRCPHRGVALSRGRVRGDELECGYHGFRFAADGHCTHMPCEGTEAKIPKAMCATSFQVREAHGLIWLWWGADAKTLGKDELPAIPWHVEIPDSCRYTSQRSYRWDVSFYRATESNFDTHHAPYLHPQLAAKQTLMDEMECTSNEDRIVIQGALCRPDNRASRMPFTIRFRFPGVTYFSIGSILRFAVLDTPVDDTTTWRFLRYYNVKFKVPVLGKIWIEAMQGMDYLQTQVLQDLPMVKTMKLPEPGIYADKLVGADAGIARHMQLRRQLMRQASGEAHLLPDVVRRHFVALEDQAENADTAVHVDIGRRSA